MEKKKNTDCIFCNIDKERIICENKSFVAIYDGFPVSKGHTLIIPKEHMEYVTMIRKDMLGDLHDIINEVITKLDAEFKPDGYNIGANCGEAAGQTVKHAHIHIIPRFNNDVENPRGGVRGVIPSKQSY